MNTTNLETSRDIQPYMGDVDNYFILRQYDKYMGDMMYHLNRWTKPRLLPKNTEEKSSMPNVDTDCYTLQDILARLPRSIISTEGALLNDEKRKFTRAIISTNADKEYIGYYDFTHRLTPCLVGSIIEINSDTNHTHAAALLLKWVGDEGHMEGK